MSYTRILSRLYNTPLAINEAKLAILNSEVTVKLLAGEALAVGVAQSTSKPLISLPEGVVLIEVFDSLVAKGGAGESGCTSYQALKGEIDYAINNGNHTLLFYIDSPGGEVSGCFALSDYIASLPSTYGVKTVAFTDGLMTSAAYAIGSACQRVYASNTASIGSIGVLMTLIDRTQAIADAGLKPIILRSKAQKAIGSPMEGYTQDVLDKFTAMLTKIDAIFNATVSKNRPVLTLSAINTLEGASLLAEDALAVNLIDGIVSDISQVIKMSTQSVAINNSLLTERGGIMTFEEVKAALAAKETDYAALAASVDKKVAEAVASERARCADIYAAAATLHISDSAKVAKQINKGATVEDARDYFTDLAEMQSKATAVASGAGLADQNVPNGTTTASSESNKTSTMQVAGISVPISDIVAAAKEAKVGA